MNEAHDKTSKPRVTSFHFMLLALAVAVVLALALIIVLKRRIESAARERDPYATVPFHPQVTYDSQNVSVLNTEAEPYLNTRLNVYVGGTLYWAQIGTIQPGQSVTCSLSSLTNERGESFQPHSPQTSELEVRAHFGGYDVHKDIPPP